MEYRPCPPGARPPHMEGGGGPRGPGMGGATRPFAMADGQAEGPPTRAPGYNRLRTDAHGPQEEREGPTQPENNPGINRSSLYVQNSLSLSLSVLPQARLIYSIVLVIHSSTRLRVRHDQQDAVELHERLLEPHAGLEVQVVGGLGVGGGGRETIQRGL